MSEPRTIIVTGGGRGLGLAAAEKLARAGHRVLLTARDRKRGEQAVQQIHHAVPGGRVELRILDLAALASVRAFAGEVLHEGLVVDVLLHNAGIMQQSRERRVTGDGFEETLQTNTLAPFLLTRELLPALARSTAARVVCVSSMLHMPGTRGEPVNFDFDDPQLLRGYHPDRAYKNSKLALLWWTYELQRRLAPRPITANAVCPGFVPVTAAESVRGPMRWFMRHVLAHMPFARSLDQAAGALAWMAVDPAMEGVGGKYYTDRAELRSSDDSLDPALAARFWRLACELVAIPDWP
ncbi:MAG: SDR family NAD(P)-dependent oxidoreductase [Nannocystis sp.]|uniref:SDR family NAD(P)-dependent oxidoreductase n=1 Tax=Nannocystis sp. TaxID=1962667 RepID=UPI002422D238|nr:SDR family NAD(P)-dependent oxidoreductase [Nannocystis sp.]MBK9754656.1 SDR family NAD(P)-dependent oxidoreductase [Nannocystis sp.]